MIFSQLFSPKHKSSDPEKRLASIESLNKSLEKDKRILHELAFNDDDDKVSIAALNKLDSFVLWMKSAETSHSTRVKKHAQQVCVSQLEDDNKVTDKLFLAFIKEAHNKALLEQLLFSSKRLQQIPDLITAVLFTLNNTNHIRRFFQEFASAEQQLALVKETNDAKTLNRFLKYGKDEFVIASINKKLAHLIVIAEQPKKIKQQVTMINSRLLALKEAQDYEYLATQLEQLSNEFEQVKLQFDCLDELSIATMTEKYLGLKVDLQKKLGKLEEGHKSQLLLKQTTEDLSDIQERCAQVQIQLNLILNAALSEESNSANIDSEVKILTLSLDNAINELKEIDRHAKTQAHTARVKQLQTQIANMQVSLSQVFETIEYVRKANKIENELILLIDNAKQASEATEQISQKALGEIKEKVKFHKEAFEDLNKNCNGLMPTTSRNSFSNTLSLANQLIKRSSQHFRDLERTCENKLKSVNRMIGDGKFKMAMSNFSRAQNMYEAISESVPTRLQKAFEQTQLEITKLQDWQSYIAQPRKPAILEKAQQLAESEFTDPYERTEQVKQLRQEWNSLGRLNTSEDEAHNNAFDVHIEKAFVPCRAFFAEIDRQRELNYQKALKLVAEAKTLDANMPASELTSKISSLKRQLNDIGEIDKTKLSKIKREFAKKFKPLSVVISKQQTLNAEQKQTAIKQVIQLNAEAVEDEQLSEAIDKAKSLQQKWKQFGFAGKTVDNQLWIDFRQANDALFERYHQTINNKKSAQQQQFKALEDEINKVTKAIVAAESVAGLQFYDQEHKLLLTKIQDAEEDTQKRIQQKFRKMEEAFSACIKNLNKLKDETALANLFTFMNDYSSEELPEQFETLLSRYKTWIKGEVASVPILDGLNRIALTQVSAILFDIAYNDVPFGDKEVRKELQLKMMASKLQGDAKIDTELVLAKWISLGPVQKTEQESLQAMQRMYVG